MRTCASHVNRKTSLYERQNLRICVTLANPQNVRLERPLMTLTCHPRLSDLMDYLSSNLPLSTRLFIIFRITYIRAWRVAKTYLPLALTRSASQIAIRGSLRASDTSQIQVKPSFPLKEANPSVSRRSMYRFITIPFQYLTPKLQPCIMEQQRETGEQMDGIAQRGHGVLKPFLFGLLLVTPSIHHAALHDLPVDRFGEPSLDPAFHRKMPHVPAIISFSEPLNIPSNATSYFEHCSHCKPAFQDLDRSHFMHNRITTVYVR